ncbi:MAG: S41 family peptidase [Deltaproteobacteria bacterium]|nr:S41 family peptidase [Deltaproteobacteria bacterium]
MRLIFAVLVSVLTMVCAELSLSRTAPTSFDRYQSLETFARAVYYLENMYVDPSESQLPSLIEHALEGIVAKMDPHTTWLSKRAFNELTLDTKGQIGGVGIIVKVDKDHLIIVSAIPDKPAHRAGIKDGDEIVKINDIPLEKIGPDSVEVMRGPPGTSLKLTVRRKDQEKLLEFTMTREVITISAVNTYQLSEGVFHVQITAFQENTAETLLKFLQEHKGKVKGIVFDLRDNPGGLLEEAVKIADLFIESGLIVSTVGRHKDRIEREFAHKQNSFLDFPMILLINGGSASASEIVAGALQDHQRALIMGTTSFGKGSVQTLIGLPDGSGLKMTVATYYTPLDRSIQARGIQPDIVLNSRVLSPDQAAKKEVNLKGHIISDDLSDLSKKGTILNEIKDWPEALASDYQLVTAFTHLKGWQVFLKP